MTDARTEILARVRAALDAGGAERRDVPLPDVFRTAERSFDATTFIERARAVGATVTEVAPSEDVGEVLRGVLRDLGAQRVAISDHADVRAAVEGYECELVEPDAPRAELFTCDVGVTTAQLGIAETGTLALRSNAERHRLTSLVPEVHVALLRRDTIVPTLDEALAADADLPRCTSFITGPSRTGDIEMELVVGVHGPMALHIVVY